MKNVLFIAILLMLSTASYGQRPMKDTVNFVEPGLESVKATYYAYKRRKPNKEGREISWEQYYPNGRIKTRRRDDIITKHNELGQPTLATFEVPMILGGSFTKYWKWEYLQDQEGQMTGYRIAKSQYGKEYTTFRHDSVVYVDSGNLRKKIVYHRFSPFSNEAQCSEYRYDFGRLIEVREYNGEQKSFITRKYTYLKNGTLSQLEIIDENGTIIYNETHQYEGTKRVSTTIRDEHGPHQVSYEYDDQGTLIAEIHYTPKGKPYAMIRYEYSYYP